MDRIDHTNLDFEALAERCSPFVQDLVMYVITNMHEELEEFLKEHCRAIDDDEELHKHRYWDMFQGTSLYGLASQSYICSGLLAANRMSLSLSYHVSPFFFPLIFFFSFSWTHQNKKN